MGDTDTDAAVSTQRTSEESDQLYSNHLLNNNETLNSIPFIPRTPHYVTGPFMPSSTFLADEEYGRCLDIITKACKKWRQSTRLARVTQQTDGVSCQLYFIVSAVFPFPCKGNDLLLTHKGKVLIGKRTMWPQKNWWYCCGGRMKPGESVTDSSSRLLARECKLHISSQILSKRLLTIGHYSFVWAYRQQLPHTNGTSDISVVTSLDLTEQEKITVESSLAEQYKWQTADEIISNDFHPALKRGIQDWLKVDKMIQLDRIVRVEKGTDSDIAKVAKELVDLSFKASQNDYIHVLAEETM